MNKKVSIKFLIILLIASILSTLCFYSNAKATNEKNNTIEVVALDRMLDKSMLQSMNFDLDEKIMMYDSTTGETVEVDMEELQNSAKSYNVNEEKKNYTEAYNPATTIDDNIQMTKSNYVQILNTNPFPYKQTCRIKCDVYGNEGVATGFLVGPNLLLTSAHCVMNLNDGDGFFADWVAYPGYNNGSYYGNPAGWTRVYFSDNWKTTHSPSYDWCLCVLGDDLGSQVGWYGCQAYGVNSEMNNLEVRPLGYPKEIQVGERLCYSRGNITTAYDRYFDASNYISEGMSGGPFARTSDNVAVGITHGYYAEGGSCATRITQDIIDLINQLRQ